jgi:all-trans-retinol 13,14-reductase
LFCCSGLFLLTGRQKYYQQDNRNYSKNSSRYSKIDWFDFHCYIITVYFYFINTVIIFLAPQVLTFQFISVKHKFSYLKYMLILLSFFIATALAVLQKVLQSLRVGQVRNFSGKKFIDELPTHSGPVERDGYSKKKVPKDIDAIVIGSGIGGLTCAGLLSRAGKRVLVLEQHYIAGGCTHSFVEHGYEFDTGLHYMGNIDKRKKILDLITEEPIEWDKMGTKENGYVYDEIRIGKLSQDLSKVEQWHEYDLPAGREAFVKLMVSKFPKEEATILKYLDIVKQAASKDLFFNLKIVQSKWLTKVLNFLFGDKFFKLKHRTALEVVSQLTDNEDLRAALLGQFGDYGRLPSEESFFLHASVVQHYLEGGYYPRGGSTVFARQIIPVIERTGGRCLVRKAVKQILVENGKACGVEMSNGDKIYANMVVSACGVPNTYKKLLEPAHVPTGLMSKIDSVGYSCSMVYLFVGLKGTPEELKLRGANIWHWPDMDYDRMLRRFNEDPENAPIPLFIGFPCAKDSDWNNRYPGKSNAVILTMCNFEKFKEWEHKRQGKRGDDYDELKKMFEKRILEGMFSYYPQLKDKVDFTMVGSPLTFNHYIGSQQGEVYGMKNTPERFCSEDWLRPKTDLPGLFLTGQDVTTLGITGAMMGGVLTAHAVLGYGTVTDVLSGRNLITDLMAHQTKKSTGKVKVF